MDIKNPGVSHLLWYRRPLEIINYIYSIIWEIKHREIILDGAPSIRE